MKNPPKSVFCSCLCFFHCPLLIFIGMGWPFPWTYNLHFQKRKKKKKKEHAFCNSFKNLQRNSRFPHHSSGNISQPLCCWTIKLGPPSESMPRHWLGEVVLHKIPTLSFSRLPSREHPTQNWEFYYSANWKWTQMGYPERPRQAKGKAFCVLA